MREKLMRFGLDASAEEPIHASEKSSDAGQRRIHPRPSDQPQAQRSRIR